MSNRKKAPMKYKRDKNGVEISGDADQIKWPVWFDLASSRLIWVLLVAVLLFTIPRASWVPLAWQWARKLFLSG